MIAPTPSFLSRAFMAVAAVLLCSSNSGSDSATPSFGVAALTAQDQNTLLSLHNKYRAAVVPTAAVMPALLWSASLASYAQNYANTCPSGHSGGPYGENLAWGSPAESATVAMTSWQGEQADYTYSSNSCTSVCGHYTQIIWAATTSVGCATAHCPSLSVLGGAEGDVWVCSYDPPGNYVGQKPYTAGTPAAAPAAAATAQPTAKPVAPTQPAAATPKPVVNTLPTAPVRNQPAATATPVLPQQPPVTPNTAAEWLAEWLAYQKKHQASNPNFHPPQQAPTLQQAAAAIQQRISTIGSTFHQ